MAKSIAPRHIALREQKDGSFRPRFQPGERVRALGFMSFDLRHGMACTCSPGCARDGSWYSFGQARNFSVEIVRKIEAARTEQAPLGPAPVAAVGWSLAHLLDEWLAAVEADETERKLSAHTKSYYRFMVAAVKWKPGIGRAQRTPDNFTDRELLSLAPMTAVGWPELNEFFNKQKKARTLHLALGMMGVISAAWTWGKASPKWRLGPNPRLGEKLQRPKGRIVIWTVEELHALIAAADACGRPSVGDAVVLGLMTGQRQYDRLNLIDGGSAKGRQFLRQSKGDVIVDIKEAPQLTKRLGEARLRVSELMLRRGQRERPAEIVVSEATGAAYDSGNFTHVFGAVRNLAYNGSPALGLVPCPSLRVPGASAKRPLKTDQDLRDTAITMMFHAGASIQAICNVSGHSYAAVETIRKHYLARDAGSADKVIDKLSDYYDKIGLAI